MSIFEQSNSNQGTNLSNTQEKLTSENSSKIILGFKRERTKDSEILKESKKILSNINQNLKENSQNIKISEKNNEISKNSEKKMEISSERYENIQKSKIHKIKNPENQDIIVGKKICDFCKNSDESQQFLLTEISSDIIKEFLFNKFNIKSENFKNTVFSFIEKFFNNKKEISNNKNEIFICESCLMKDFINESIPKLFLINENKLIILKNLLNLNEKIYEKIKIISASLKKIFLNIENYLKSNENQKLQKNLNECLTYLTTNTSTIKKLIENNDDDINYDQNSNSNNQNFSIHSNYNISFIGENKNQNNRDKKLQYAIYTKNYIHEVNNEKYSKSNKTKILTTKVPYIIQESETYKAKKNLMYKNLKNEENNENAFNNQDKYINKIKPINSINNMINNNIFTPLSNNIKNDNIAVLKKNIISNDINIANDDNIKKLCQFDNFLVNYLINSDQINQQLINKTIFDIKNSNIFNKDVISANNNIYNTINFIKKFDNVPLNNFNCNSNVQIIPDNSLDIVDINTSFLDNTNKINIFKTNAFNSNNYLNNINTNNSFIIPNQQNQCYNNYNNINTLSMLLSNKICGSYCNVNCINPNILNTQIQNIEINGINNNINNMNNNSNNVNLLLYSSRNLEKEN